MTILKLIAALLCRPLIPVFLLVAAGLLLLRGPRRRAAALLIAAGGISGYLASIPLVGGALLAPLEGQYPAFTPADAKEVQDIVVLGSSYEPDDRVSITSALDPDGLARIVEGVRLALAYPDARLLVSGGARPGFVPSALGYKRLATELGIKDSRLIVMDRALDTNQEARDVAARLGHSPFILVTSAYHLPRAMRLMRRAGANPLPAAAGRLSPMAQDERFGLIPSSSGLRETEAALHEYLGLAAITLGIQ